DELKKYAKDDLDLARNTLINAMCNYRGFTECKLILVFDAYKVRGNVRETEQIGGISVVYTKEAETADMYIEKATHELGKKYRVRVATSDRLEQIIILGNNAYRMSASEFHDEVMRVENEIRGLIFDNNSSNMMK
ncbi:MAG: NYN domain-containing protein, partial [Ruminiclostridium sp.]|nr:NYN domain-containing protein [Ruminiclostridium sp.]